MAKIYHPPQLKENRFFCDHCNKEVSFNAEVCHSCGKTFDSVQCPVCKFTAKPVHFLNGCPQCGYLSNTTGLGRKGLSGDQNRRRPPKGKGQDLMIPILSIGVLILLGAVFWAWLNNS